jgi:hypothetical protein
MAVENEILDLMKFHSAAHSTQVVGALRKCEDTASILLLARELSTSNAQATAKSIECWSPNLAENTVTSAQSTIHTNSRCAILFCSIQMKFFSRNTCRDPVLSRTRLFSSLSDQDNRSSLCQGYFSGLASPVKVPEPSDLGTPS